MNHPLVGGPGHVRPRLRPAPRRARALAVALAVPLLAAAFLPATPGLAQSKEKDSPCTLTRGKWAAPTFLWLGEATTVTLTSTTDCPAKLIPLHVVLSIDASLSMAPPKIDDAKRAARRFVERMNLEVSRVGVTSFDMEPHTLSELTDMKGRVLSAINGIQLLLGTDIAGGIEESRGILVRGRSRNRDPNLPDPLEIIIVLSDGHPWPGPAGAVTAAAGRAKSQGILIISICVGNNCNASLMRSVASRSDLFFDVRNSSGLFAVYDRLASQLLETRLRRMEITDVLPDNMRYVADSADPAPAQQDGQTLKWDWSVIDTKGITVSFQVQPLEEGVWPTNVYAWADFWDTEGRIGHGEFPTPTVEVRVPTATPTAPFTATPEPTKTPLATATPLPRPIYLPLLLWERCDPTVLSTDVALVIDVSSSMEGPTRAGGRPKREAARRAALAFVDLLGPRDQAAVVVFSEQARLLVPLGVDRRSLRRALAELPRSRGTRIDAGLAMAREVLTGPGRNPDHTPAILLLTDGRPTRSSEADVRAAAARARRAGLTVFAVGLGGDVNPELLRDVAGDPGRYFPAPGTDELTGVYRRIAGVIPCPGGRHKWGEPWP